MIEIVFSESAEGGLKLAQSYGRGKCHGGCASVFLGMINGRKPTAAEIEAARLEAEEKERRAWEEAQPIGGSAADVYCFPLALGFGEISECGFWEKRRYALEQLTAIWPEHIEHENRISGAKKNLEAVLARCRDETVRIWTSDNPDEACGMHWLLAQLVKKACEIRIVKLPKEELRENSLTEYLGWAEVHPGEWHRFLKYEEVLSDLQIRARVCRWRELQEENMPLRVMVGGRLTSMNADAFDHFIRWEIDQAGQEFRQARVIGAVLGKHPFGFGDGFIAMRMEEMIRRGELEILEEAGEGEPSYRRKLKKPQC